MEESTIAVGHLRGKAPGTTHDSDGVRGGIRTLDLRVMSPLRCHCATQTGENREVEGQGGRVEEGQGGDGRAGRLGRVTVSEDRDDQTAKHTTVCPIRHRGVNDGIQGIPRVSKRTHRCERVDTGVSRQTHGPRSHTWVKSNSPVSLALGHKQPTGISCPCLAGRLAYPGHRWPRE